MAITAKTGSGGIEITQTGRGDVNVSSSSGTVRVHGVRGGVDASTSSGGLHIEGEMASDWRLSASSGHVTVALPKSQRFDLDATSTSGHIDVDFPITLPGASTGNRSAEPSVAAARCSACGRRQAGFRFNDVDRIRLIRS